MLCGSQECIGDVKRFKYLPVSHKKKIESFLSPFLKKNGERKTLNIIIDF